MMEVDLALFRFINVDLSNPLFDVFFPWWTDIQKTPIFLYVFLPLLLGYKIYKKDTRFFKVLIILAIVLYVGSSFNHYFVKPYFDRARPVAEILRIKAQGSPSFPSGHTISAFIIAFVLSYFYPRKRWIFISLALLMGFSRIYCGVHYPSDILGGIMLAFLVSFIMLKLLLHQSLNFLKLTFAFLIFIPNLQAYEWNDPTNGKAFFPWVWEDELKPTLIKASDETSLIILASAAASVTTASQYDSTVYNDNRRHQPFFDQESAKTFGKIGNGGLGIGIALTQILFDQENGINHTKAIFLTSFSHMSLSALFQRDRPNNGNDFLPWSSSFPSGHTSSAFATAGSLAYSYGWKAGVPAYTLASLISYSRVRMEKHWVSDIVAGAFLGSFWARASFESSKREEEKISIIPSPIFDGMMLTAIKKF